MAQQNLEKLSVNTPQSEVKLDLLVSIAEEHKIEWDSSKLKELLRLKRDDLLVILSSTPFPQLNHLDSIPNLPFLPLHLSSG